MCSYCGCEAESVIAGLMADHAKLGDLAYRICRALDDQRLDEAAGLIPELAKTFARHSLREETGLFAELRQRGEAVGEIDRLVGEHCRLRPALAAESLVNDVESLRVLLAELAHHAEIEDNDLFPFAMQLLPDACWAELVPASMASRSSTGRAIGRD
jgi:hemerythrin-like domain-containing protein